VLTHLSPPLHPSCLGCRCGHLPSSTSGPKHATTLTPPPEHVIVPDLPGGPFLDLGFPASPTPPPPPTFGHRCPCLPTRRWPQPSTPSRRSVAAQGVDGSHPLLFIEMQIGSFRLLCLVHIDWLFVMFIKMQCRLIIIEPCAAIITVLGTLTNLNLGTNNCCSIT
jgi:hypothetical protein